MRDARNLTALESAVSAYRRRAPSLEKELSRRLQTVEERLLAEAHAFDFFQAVRLLEQLDPQRRPIGRDSPPAREAVRFRALASLSFPPSSIYELVRPASTSLPVMTVTFMGLTGPSGVLPRHYTELLLRLQKEAKGPEKFALRDWFDLFNHRFIALFYRAWEKYRFYIAYERGDYGRTEPDPFTRCLFSLVGLGIPSLRNRLYVGAQEAPEAPQRRRVLGRVEDLVVLFYSGLFSQRHRTAVGLEALLRDYWQLPIHVQQFQPQWLQLDATNQSRLGVEEGNNRLGVDCVAGERVLDVQGKFRIRVGPLPYQRFLGFLPDREPVPERKAFFLLAQLVRLYAGPELDFDIQLVLQAEDVPECKLDLPAWRPEDGDMMGPRLGWNTWLRSQTPPAHVEDACFEGETVVVLNENDHAGSLAGPI